MLSLERLHTQKGILSYFLVPCCLLLAAFACGKQSKVDGTISTQKSDTLSIGNGREPVTLDPHRAASWADLRVIEGLFEGLVLLDPVTKEPIGGVSERWETWNNGKNWRFHIRNDAKWSDGSPLTARDFVRSARRMLDPAFGSDIVVHFLYPLKKAEAFHRGDLDRFSEVGIEAGPDNTLLLELGYASAAFLTQLSYFFPIKEADFPENGYLDGKFRWGRGEATTSNGAYFLDDWITNERIVLVKNEHYWDAENVRLGRIEILPIEDSVAEERAFRNGQIQITAKVPSGKVQWYQDNDPEKLRIDDRMGLFFIQLNHSVYPLGNPKVRKALAKSINRREIVESVLKDGKRAASRIVPPEVLGGFDEESALSFNVPEAKALLEEAGFPGGVGFPKLTFLINTSAAYQSLAEAVQFAWKKHLGIEVEIENQEWKTFLGAVEAGNYQIARYGYVPLYPDAYPLFQIFTAEGTDNFTGWVNPSFDSLIERARQEVESERRKALFREAEALLLGEAPIIPIFFYNSVYLIDPEISGWHPDLMDRHPFKFVRVSP